ncbi:carboxypeptidase PM20D1 [Algoriphagus boseongensis]|uniref:Carboxypeptidase PM20D1 n=1 Tax=Algoriphagus boseongensis TaxID=1442587 RepID=A0A4R6TC70_9BACT|nr:M20 family peptidase [Algoriphagus boseongensis]TDQ19295.1 carboxypeptidase PM20D1 [Algoriphagus boseongensis]
MKTLIYSLSLIFLPTFLVNAQGTKPPTKVELVNVQVDADAAAKRLSEGIKFKTISNQDRTDFDENAFKEWHAFLEKTYPLTHQTLKKEILGDPRKFSLLYTWEGANKALAPVVLMGHQDVVPVVPGTESQWEHDAYSGDIADGYIWGRGSLDDKVMIMAILESIEMHLKKGLKPERTIYLVFGQDEEVMGPEGVSQVVKELESRGIKEIAMVLDEGLPLAPGQFPGIKAPTALIGTAEKGYLTLELKVSGPGGHSGMPPKNSNIGILALAITKLEANPFPNRITDVVRDQYKTMGPFLSEEQQKLIAKDDTFIEFMLTQPMTTAMIHTTTAVTMVNGGIKENVLPPFASALVNFRILQGETVASVVEHVNKVIDDKRVTVTELPASIDPSPISSSTGPEFQLIEKTIRQTWGTPDLIVVPYLVIGGADAKYFAASPMTKNVYRFTALRVESAADTQRWHGVNERVLITEYAKSIGFFYQFIGNLKELK